MSHESADLRPSSAFERLCGKCLFGIRSGLLLGSEESWLRVWNTTVDSCVLLGGHASDWDTTTC
jgi:hypothetical protein